MHHVFKHVKASVCFYIFILNFVLIRGTRGLFALNLARFAWLSMHSQALDFVSLGWRLLSGRP